VGRSFLLTAAGQFRIFTGFPFHPPERPAGTLSEDDYIKGEWMGQRQYIVDIL
jgi:hypothetical protein